MAEYAGMVGKLVEPFPRGLADFGHDEEDVVVAADQRQHLPLKLGSVQLARLGEDRQRGILAAEERVRERRRR